MATSLVEVIKDLPPYDGEYEFPLADLNGGEYHFIRQVCGLRSGEIEDGLKAGDVGLFIAITAVALRRKGFANVNMQQLWDASDDCFAVYVVCPHCQAKNDKNGETCSECGERMGDDGRPLATATSGGSENENEESTSLVAKETPSG